MNTDLFYLSGKKERCRNKDRRSNRHLFLEVVCKKCGCKRFVRKDRLNSRCPKCQSLGDIYERISNRYSISKSGCHEWTSYLSKKGYAKINYKGKCFGIAKLIFEKKLNRKLKKGYETCHICNNSKCINPEHLYEGTHRQNGRDLSKSGILNGEKGPNVKITEKRAIQIKVMLKKEITVTNISKKLSVPRTIVANIKYGQSWRWLKV